MRRSSYMNPVVLRRARSGVPAVALCMGLLAGCGSTADHSSAVATTGSDVRPTSAEASGATGAATTPPPPGVTPSATGALPPGSESVVERASDDIANGRTSRTTETYVGPNLVSSTHDTTPSELSKVAYRTSSGRWAIDLLVRNERSYAVSAKAHVQVTMLDGQIHEYDVPQISAATQAGGPAALELVTPLAADEVASYKIATTSDIPATIERSTRLVIGYVRPEPNGDIIFAGNIFTDKASTRDVVVGLKTNDGWRLFATSSTAGTLNPSGQYVGSFSRQVFPSDVRSDDISTLASDPTAWAIWLGR